MIYHQVNNAYLPNKNEKEDQRILREIQKQLDVIESFSALAKKLKDISIEILEEMGT